MVGLNAAGKNDEDEPEVHHITRQDAKKFIPVLQRRLCKKALKTIVTCSKFTELQSQKGKCQRKLYNFFQKKLVEQV